MRVPSQQAQHIRAALALQLIVPKTAIRTQFEQLSSRKKLVVVGPMSEILFHCTGRRGLAIVYAGFERPGR
jgi:hypothetical protein